MQQSLRRQVSQQLHLILLETGVVHGGQTSAGYDGTGREGEVGRYVRDMANCTGGVGRVGVRWLEWNIMGCDRMI